MIRKKKNETKTALTRVIINLVSFLYNFSVILWKILNRSKDTRKEEFVAQNFVKWDLNRARAKFSPPPTLREGVLDRFHLLFYPIDISINSLTFTQEILRYD